MSRLTKPGSLSQDFLRAAAEDPMGGLATMFLAAFGVSLDVLMRIATKIIAENDVHVMMMAFTAGVQIRAHVVFVGRDYGNIRSRYAELVIEGGRPQQDVYNFGALHALGHMLAHVASESTGGKVLQKAGSCITGDYGTDSEAGKINKEIATTWSMTDKVDFGKWLTNAKTTQGPIVDSFIQSVPGLSKAFMAKVSRPALSSRPSAAKVT